MAGSVPPVIPADSPLAVQATAAVQSGDLEALSALLAAHPGLARERIGTEGKSRTLLHVATDWPGNYPNGPATARLLIAAGADVNARCAGPHSETPLHWAASSDDVAMLDVLLDAGADIDASGAVIGGGTPLADAVAFGQWMAARRLVKRGASMELWQVAALGPLELLREMTADEPPSPDDLTHALWCAAHGGQREVAEYLVAAGADPTWVGYDDLDAAGAADREGHHDLAVWLRAQSVA